MTKRNDKKTVPELRFRGFTDPWEQRQLGEVAEVHNGRDYKHLQPGNIPVYGTSGYMLSVDDALSWNEDAVGIGRKGTIDKPYILRAPFWTVDTLFFVTPRPSTPLEFLFTVFESVNWKSKDESTGVPSLTKQAIVNTAVKVPNTYEQCRIGGFFSTLDNLIAAAERQETLLKRKKQAYLQLMFPREGETQPRLRFAGFRGEWEWRQLSEVAEFSKGQGYSKADLCSCGTPTFLYGRMYTDYKLLITESDQYLPQNSDGVFSTAGDVIIPASGESPEEIAIASVIGKTGILVGGDLNIIKPEKSVLDSIFLALSASVGSLHNNLVSRAQGKTIVHLHNSDIATCRIGFPSLPEQHCIGEFFTALESVIAAAEKRTESLHTLKFAYLQRMFV